MQKIILHLQSCPPGCGGVRRYTRNSNVSSDFFDDVVAEEEQMKGQGDPKVYYSEDEDDEASSLCLSLAKGSKY